jgi:cholinesterase
MFWVFVAILFGLHDHGYAAPLTTKTTFTVDLDYTIQEGLLEVRLDLLILAARSHL